jgi:hypothetical protein
MIYDYFPELDGNQSIDNGKMGRQLFKGGGGGGSSSTTQNQLDPTVRPFVEYGLQEAKGLYQSDTPQYYPYQTYVDPSQQTQQALQAAQTRALAGSPLVPAAQQQQLATIQGQNLGLNPYFANALQGAAGVATTQFQDALKNIASQSSQAGRYGSGAMQDLQSRASTNLAKELTARAGELAYQNYAAERAAQERAIQSAPQMAAADYQDIQQLLNVGQTAEDYQRQALEADIGRFEFEQNLPYTKLQSYLSAAYGAPMGQVSTTTQSGGGK